VAAKIKIGRETSTYNKQYIKIPYRLKQQSQVTTTQKRTNMELRLLLSLVPPTAWTKKGSAV
jgi:hypothetical protein